MGKRNKNRAQQATSATKSRGEQLLEDADSASTRMGDDIRQGTENLRDRGRATTDAKAKARNKR